MNNNRSIEDYLTSRSKNNINLRKKIILAIINIISVSAIVVLVSLAVAGVFPSKRTVNVYNQNKEKISSIKVENNGSLNLDDLDDFEIDGVKYYFMGWVDKDGNYVSLDNINKNMNIYAKFVAGSKAIFEGNYLSNISIFIDGQPAMFNTVYRPGAKIKIIITPNPENVVSEFKLKVGNHDVVNSIEEVIEKNNNGQVYYEITVIGNGDVRITYNETPK